ncbi:19277_t:CDS:2, partial [Racocetra fulgida]
LSDDELEQGDEEYSGILQVSQGTWFLIDETVMEEGKLDDI